MKIFNLVDELIQSTPHCIEIGKKTYFIVNFKKNKKCAIITHTRHPLNYLIT